jgi:hypothetical protein
VIKVQLRTQVVRDKFAGYRPKPNEVSLLLNSDAAVYKPSGELLCLLRRGALSGPELEQARPHLRYLKKYKTDARVSYQGGATVHSVSADGVHGKSNRTFNADGKRDWVASAIVGYFDRMGGRHPYCRATAFTAQEVERWKDLLPLVGLAAGEFQRELPERYARQAEQVRKCRPEWIIKGTPFSTLTVNNNVIAATHKDAGDFKDGFGLIACARSGSYRGGWLVFPEFGVAADLHDGDLIYFNSHDWHGLTPFEDASDDHERISVVFYLREKMERCGTPAEELANAKRVRGALTQ